MPIIKAMHLQIEIKLPFKAGLGVAESQNVVHTGEYILTKS